MVSKMTAISQTEARVRLQGAVHLKFVTDKMRLRQIFLQVLRFCAVISHSPVLHIYSSIVGGMGNGPVRVHSSTDIVWPHYKNKRKQSNILGAGTFETRASSLSPLLQIQMALNVHKYPLLYWNSNPRLIVGRPNAQLSCFRDLKSRGNEY
jgi:hypothetical protein